MMDSEITVLFGKNGFIGNRIWSLMEAKNIPFITVDSFDADIVLDASNPDFSFLYHLPKQYENIAIINCIGANHKAENTKQSVDTFNRLQWKNNTNINLDFPFELMKVLKNAEFENVLIDLILIGSLYANRGPKEKIYSSLDHMSHKDIGYVASKHALSGLVKAAAQFRNEKYRVNLINPGTVLHPDMAESFVQDFSAVFGAYCNDVSELASFIINLRFSYWTLMNFSEIDLTGGALR